ncbi:hypothetical protein IKQ21_04475 [bacterium]|nr:hypothetical protein [bacterium]
MKINPVKKFFTSLYYANKPLETAPRRFVIFGDGTSERLGEKIAPYLEGYQQLAEKYNFVMHTNSVGNRDFISVNETLINIPKDMTAPDIARKVYQTVSESLK